MKIWISKNSEVPISEQLATQITLGIAAGDFALGEKLPSTREIARRCGVHSNTVGSVYRRLVDQNLLEFRQGSGFYVTESAGRRIEGSRRLDELISKLLQEARLLGFAEEDVLKRLRRPKRTTVDDRVIVVESDEGLRDILLHELSALERPLHAISFEDFASGRLKRSAILAAMFDEKPKLEGILRDGQKCVYLKGRSVSAALQGETRPASGDLIGVVSGWDGFLTFARVILLAAQIDPGNLIVRSTSEKGWERAIKNASLVICDSLTSTKLNGRDGVRSFQVVSDESIEEVRCVLEEHHLSS